MQLWKDLSTGMKKWDSTLWVWGSFVIKHCHLSCFGGQAFWNYAKCCVAVQRLENGGVLLRELFAYRYVFAGQTDSQQSCSVVLEKRTERQWGGWFLRQKQETEALKLSIPGMNFEVPSSHTEVAEFNCFGSHQQFWPTCSVEFCSIVRSQRLIVAGRI